MIIVYIPLTKCRDTLPYMIEKYFAKPYLLSFCALAFTEQNIKARLNRYIIILEGYVQYFGSIVNKGKTHSYFTILLCGFYSVTLFVPNIVPFCST